MARNVYTLFKGALKFGVPYLHGYNGDPHYVIVNWLRVSLERKRDVKERCGVGVQERFESCEKIDRYTIFSDDLSGLQMTLM